MSGNHIHLPADELASGRWPASSGRARIGAVVRRWRWRLAVSLLRRAGSPPEVTVPRRSAALTSGDHPGLDEFAAKWSAALEASGATVLRGPQ